MRQTKDTNAATPCVSAYQSEVKRHILIELTIPYLLKFDTVHIDFRRQGQQIASLRIAPNVNACDTRCLMT
eukprot:scaffold6753_cov20-Prasinocladus_malaysianus.AAC.1